LSSVISSLCLKSHARCINRRVALKVFADPVDSVPAFFSRLLLLQERRAPSADESE
jgi:hypothetical protein